MSYRIAITLVAAGTLLAVAETPPTSRLPYKSAQLRALASVPGKIMSGGLEDFHGFWVYTFEIKDVSGKVRHLNLDARTGAVLAAIPSYLK